MEPAFTTISKIACIDQHKMYHTHDTPTSFLGDPSKVTFSSNQHYSCHCPLPSATMVCPVPYLMTIPDPGIPPGSTAIDCLPCNALHAAYYLSLPTFTQSKLQNFWNSSSKVETNYTSILSGMEVQKMTSDFLGRNLLAARRTILWTYMGPTFCLEPGAFRADFYGMPSVTPFLDHYFRYFQVQVSNNVDNVEHLFYCNNQTDMCPHEPV